MARLELNGDGSPIRHQTISRIVSGATLVQVAGRTLLITSMSEPSENTLGSAQFVNVLHLDRPLEVVAAGYNGGQTTLTIVEEQTPGRRNPYKAAGFADANHFTDIINHTPFTIVQIFYNSDGSQSVRKLFNCRVLQPIVPQGPLARETTRPRVMNIPIGYTHMTHSGAI